MEKGNYAQVNGLNMYYEINGSGEPLVLIHGGGSTIKTSFGNILPLFAKKYKTIAVELQAHGHTSDRPGPETFQQDADDVASLLHELNIAKASILGFSNGGSTALQIAIRHPQVVHKVVAISAAYLREGLMPGFFDMMKTADLDSMPQPLKDEFLKINPDQAALENMHNKDRDRMIAFEDWSKEEVSSISAPTLIINADKDVITCEHAIKMCRLIPNAELMILPGTHGSFIGEICTIADRSKMTELTASAIQEFLDK